MTFFFNDFNMRNIISKSFWTTVYRNNQSMGCLNYGNPFWPENQSGDNGICSELELGIVGHVSKWVTAQARLKSRFGATWHDFWENGDIAYDDPNTSGESLGMNHAEYIKLRGYSVRIRPPIPTLQFVHLGSSNLSQYNPWTVGRIRYIDRDNAKGFFFHGEVSTKRTNFFTYEAAAIALPKLWVGPSWSTGLGEDTSNINQVVDPFWTQDWAYVLKFVNETFDWGRFTLIGMITTDFEANLADPDATGTEFDFNAHDLEQASKPMSERRDPRDGAVDLDDRYKNGVITLQSELYPSELFEINALLGYSASHINPNLALNGVELNEGVFPMVYKNVQDFAGVLRINILDPFENGLSFKTEGFYIGPHWTSTFGARREADVLLTDGFYGGGQLPTLNIANEFMDFDEDFYESCVGWYGATGVVEYESDNLSLLVETTYIGYATNGQDRNVDTIYPDFLHTDGYMDQDLFDYTNTNFERGRDPRAVFRRNQDRQTFIGLIRSEYTFSQILQGWKLTGQFKTIYDHDNQSETVTFDDYRGVILKTFIGSHWQFNDEFGLGADVEYNYWREASRSGALGIGYNDYITNKWRPRLTLTYDFGGARFAWVIEYLNKKQQRFNKPEDVGSDSKAFAKDLAAEPLIQKHIVRSKLTFEVAW
jgi:hypothetical protein